MVIYNDIRPHFTEDFSPTDHAGSVRSEEYDQVYGLAIS